MIELEADNAVDWLHRTGRLDPAVPAEARLLAWGVSNVVLRVHPAAGDDLVMKQSRTRLRTKAPWFSRLERIWREVELMRALGPLLPPGTVPRVLFEDRENYLFAMEAVAADHVVWKAALLGGVADPAIAAVLGDYLATIHRETAGDASLRERWIDRTVFDELRVDPFYRRIAEAHRPLRRAIEAMIDEMFATAVCVVHADFSPKNVLITSGAALKAGQVAERGQAPAAGKVFDAPVPENAAGAGPLFRITLVDFETGHYGDPAFDLGFFLSHLLLKTVLHARRCGDFLALARTFWTRYAAGLAERACEGPFARPELERRTISHLAGCMLARLDGTSPIDYLPDAGQQDLVRDFSRRLFLNPPDRLEATFGALEDLLES